MKLYGYWRSSSTYRVRIALALKGLDHEQAAVHLVRGGGEQHAAEYRAINPEGLVPALALDDGRVLTQSVAIVEYLEEIRPDPPLLPVEPVARAEVRAFAQAVACDIQPLNNLRVLTYLRDRTPLDEIAVDRWYGHWIAEGFAALETRLQRFGRSRYAFGDAPTMADVFLVPQVYNALRYECSLADYPRIRAVYEACGELEAFRRAVPEAQPDARA
jgi:maleylacetoacetate isomerase